MKYLVYIYQFKNNSAMKHIEQIENNPSFNEEMISPPIKHNQGITTPSTGEKEHPSSTDIPPSLQTIGSLLLRTTKGGEAQ